MNNDTSEQNGRQRYIQQQTVAPPANQRKPATSSTSLPDQKPDRICRDFVWGICSKGGQCIYEHVLKLESMRKILKFCHDYQNRSGCNRPGCTYLHTTNEEQKLFMTKGQIPKVLQDRYAMYYKDYLQAPPPPPPPPPPPTPAAVPQYSAPLPIPILLAPPPPPPPTVATAPTNTTPAVFTAPQTLHVSTNLFPRSKEVASKPTPVLIEQFDPSKPPPPLPTNTTKKCTVKRTADLMEAGPSNKRSKQEILSFCECCIQRKIRVEVFRKEIGKLEREKEMKSTIVQRKRELASNGKLLLKSTFSPALYRILEAYIEQPPSPLEQVSEAMSQLQLNSRVSGSTSLQSQILFNMVELARNLAETGPRLSVFNNTPRVGTPTLLDMLCNANSTQKPSTSIVPHIPNGVSNHIEIQKQRPNMHASNVTLSQKVTVARNATSAQNINNILNIYASSGQSSQNNVQSMYASNAIASQKSIQSMFTPNTSPSKRVNVPNMHVSNATTTSKSGTIPNMHVSNTNSSKTVTVSNMYVSNATSSKTGTVPNMYVSNATLTKIGKIPNKHVSNATTSKSANVPNMYITNATSSKNGNVPNMYVPNATSSKTSNVPNMVVSNATPSKTGTVPNMYVPNATTSKSGNVPNTVASNATFPNYGNVPNMYVTNANSSKSGNVPNTTNYENVPNMFITNANASQNGNSYNMYAPAPAPHATYCGRPPPAPAALRPYAGQPPLPPPPPVHSYLTQPAPPPPRGYYPYASTPNNMSNVHMFNGSASAPAMVTARPSNTAYSQPSTSYMPRYTHK